MGVFRLLFEQAPSQAVLALAYSLDLFCIEKGNLRNSSNKILLTLELFSCFLHGDPSKFLGFFLCADPKGNEVLSYIYVGIIDHVFFVLWIGKIVRNLCLRSNRRRHYEGRLWEESSEPYRDAWIS